MERLYVSLKTPAAMSGMEQKYVLQEKKKKQDDIDAVRGTVKAALLTNDSNCSGMVMLSYYDSKPVYLLSNACEEIVWKNKKRKVFSKTDNKCVEINYLCPNLVDEYNNGMNNVDIADQLRLIYRMDRWMRKRKWWWSIFFWGFEVLMVNAYVTYVKFFKMHDLTPPLSHYEFQRSIALAWLCPDKYWVPQEDVPLPLAICRQQNSTQRALPHSHSSTTISTLSSEPGRRITRMQASAMETTTVSTPTASPVTDTSQTTTISIPTVRVRIEDRTLQEGSSINARRLNMGYCHFPSLPISINSSCQLHAWVSTDKTRQYKF